MTRNASINFSTILLIIFLVMESIAQAAVAPRLITWIAKKDSADHFGFHMERAGDQNGDGYADVWISQRLIRPDSVDVSALNITWYLYYGGPQMDTVPDLIYANRATIIDNVGDFNDDGIDDFLITYRQSDTTFYLSHFGLHYGGALFSATPQKTFTVTAPGGDVYLSGQFGVGADFDGDGTRDLFIAEPQLLAGQGSGRFYAGSPQLDTIPDKVFQWGSFPPYDLYGRRAIVVRNGDKYPWLALSVNGDYAIPGRVLLYNTGPAFDTIPDYFLLPPPGGQPDSWGSVLLDLGDVNGDSYEDIFASAVMTQAGDGFIYYGGKSAGIAFDTTADLEIIPNVPVAEAAGDINNDGYPDLLVGDPALNGRVWIYHGGPSMDGTVDIKIYASFTYYPWVIADFGVTLCNLGDVDGDGITDFAATAKIDSMHLDLGIVFIIAGYNGIPTDVNHEHEPGLPDKFELLQNYPNPFNGETTIEFTLPKNQHVTVEVVNALGQKVATVMDRHLQAGVHRLRWSAQDESSHDLPSGIYFCRVRTVDAELSQKMVLVK